MAAYLLRDNNELTSVNIVNLSYDGCSVETPVALVEGSKMVLSVAGLGVHHAHVTWYRNGRAGLAFKAQKPRKKDILPRNFERIELNADLTLRRVGRQHYQLRVFDVSPTGCKVEFVERPKIGELVWVKFDFLEAIEAEICWVDGFFGGARYLRPIYPAVFDLLVARLTLAKAA